MRLTPGSRQERVRGLVADADGAPMLAASVRAVPEKGRANAAMLALIARSLGIAHSQVRLCGGAGSRRKTVEIAGDPAELQCRLEQILAQESGRK